MKKFVLATPVLLIGIGGAQVGHAQTANLIEN